MNLYYIILFSLILACNFPNNKIPEGILMKDKFTAVLKHVHLAEGSYELQKKYGKEEAGNILLKEYEKIFITYNIDEQDFQNSLKYYAANPGILEEIYSEIISTISEERAISNHQETN
tara:strand:- start:51146 stop:51499 length:354 start_codon:yes stop_codon:yes gene_type:complete